MINTMDVVGGAASVAWQLGEMLRSRGHDVRYLVGYKFSESKRVDEVGLGLWRHFRNKLFRKLAYRFRYGFAFLLSNDIDRGACNEVLDHPWFKKADIVHLHNLHGNFFNFNCLGKVTKEKPSVWTLHDMWPLTSHCANCFGCGEWNNGLHFTRGWGRTQSMLWNNASYLWNRKRRIVRNSNFLLVSPSRWLAKLARSEIGQGKRIVTIPNGVNTGVFKAFDKAKARRDLLLPLEKKIVLFVSNGGILNPVKGGEYFLRLAHLRRDILFVCVGSNNSLGKDENILFFPRVNREKMVGFYSASDLLLVPSLSENFPLVTLEAMSCNLPVVAFGVGGVVEQLRHLRNGYIARVGDLEDLMLGVEWALNLSNSEAYRLKSFNRKLLLSKFSGNRMTVSYERIYTLAISDFYRLRI